MSSTFARELRLLLLGSVGLGSVGLGGLAGAGCGGQGGDVVVPPAPSGGGPVVTVIEPVSSLVRPNKDPREAMWEAQGAQCMPSWATDTKNPHPQRPACGAQPGSWLGGGGRGRGGWRQYDLDVALSTREAARRGGDACCFTHYDDYPMEGRPLDGAAGPVLAEPVARRGWGSPGARAAALGLGLRPASLCLGITSVEAARGWLEAARFEHASIASFARLALELMALGAPASLVLGAHEAALDEVRHAEDAFAIASALSGVELGPGPLAVERAAPMARSRVELAEASLRLGCVGETLAALEAWEASRGACAELRGVLEAVAEDEARHAALAFRIAAWAGRTASGAERATLRDLALAAAAHVPAAAPDRAHAPELGRLGTAESARLAEQGMREVARPALLALAAALAATRTEDATPEPAAAGHARA